MLSVRHICVLKLFIQYHISQSESSEITCRTLTKIAILTSRLRSGQTRLVGIFSFNYIITTMISPVMERLANPITINDMTNLTIIPRFDPIRISLVCVARFAPQISRCVRIDALNASYQSPLPPKKNIFHVDYWRVELPEFSFIALLF